MRRTFLTLVLLLLILFTFLTSGESKAPPLSSIKALMMIGDGHEPYVGCTTWPTVAFGTRVWVTARHCVAANGITSERYEIDGRRVVVLKSNAVADLAALTGGPAAPALVVALGPPAPLAPIWGGGYPGGTTYVHPVTGSFGGLDDGERYVIQLPTGPGMSGGPILDGSNLVVSVMAQTECGGDKPTWCPMARGITTSALRAFLELD